MAAVQMSENRESREQIMMDIVRCQEMRDAKSWNENENYTVHKHVDKWREFPEHDSERTQMFERGHDWG